MTSIERAEVAATHTMTVVILDLHDGPSLEFDAAS